MIKLVNRWIQRSPQLPQRYQGNMAVKPQIMGFDLHGRSRWLRVTAFPILDELSGTLISVHIIFEDVTPLVEAEESVRRSESRYRLRYEQSQAALAYTDALYRASRKLIGTRHVSDVLAIFGRKCGKRAGG